MDLTPGGFCEFLISVTKKHLPRAAVKSFLRHHILTTEKAKQKALEATCSFFMGFALLDGATFSFVAVISCISFLTILQGDAPWHC